MTGRGNRYTRRTRYTRRVQPVTRKKWKKGTPPTRLHEVLEHIEWKYHQVKKEKGGALNSSEFKKLLTRCFSDLGIDNPDWETHALRHFASKGGQAKKAN